jgi:hypothetical protein
MNWRIVCMEYQNSIFVFGLALKCMLITFSKTKDIGRGLNFGGGPPSKT